MKKSKNLTTGVFDNTVRDTLKTSYNITATARLTADWNFNRYVGAVATNTPSEDTDGYDIDHYPISSIVLPLRPTKGVTKAKVNEGTVSPGYTKYDSPKFYVSNQNDVYKYWTAPYPSNSSGVIANCKPRITYNSVVHANKIRIKLENTWASPAQFTISISSTTDPAGLTQIATQVTAPIADDGTITLYNNNAGWTAVKPAILYSVDIGVIEMQVTKLGPGIKRNGNVMTYRNRGSGQTEFPTTGANSTFCLISMAAHLEADLTNKLISTEDTFDFSDKSEIYPIGTVTQNTGTLTLSNDNRIFNPENPTGIYYKLIEPNTEFNLEYIYTIGGTKYSVQQFKMYATQWSNSDDDGTTTVNLADYSKYLQEVKPNQFLIENKTSTEIIWRVLDSVGFVNYSFSFDPNETEPVIPVFWTDGEKTVWETLDDLSQATQTAIYFDGTGTLQAKARSAAFRDGDAMDWNLRGQAQGANLADIISWSPTDDYEANKISVTYKTTKWKKDSTGKESQSQVWGPETDTVALNSSPLNRTMTNLDNVLYLNKNDIKIWTYSGKVQVDGEVMEYEGKEFVYYTFVQTIASDGTSTYSSRDRQVVYPTDKDSYERYNNKTPASKRHLNHFTGGLKITKRAIWNSDLRSHPVDISGYTTEMIFNFTGTSTGGQASPRGFTQNKNKSIANIITPSDMKSASDIFMAYRGTVAAQGYYAYGTRFVFNKDKAHNTQRAGISFQMGSTATNAYQVDLRLTSTMSASERKIANEVSILSGGKVIGVGSPVGIGENIWYDLDVYVTPASAGQQTITVWLNGQVVATALTTPSTKQADSARFGLYGRGRTNVSFEYLYAVSRSIPQPKNDYGFFDLKYGGTRSEMFQREYVWQLDTRYKRIKKNPWSKEKAYHNGYFFDEFGPYVHEIREFDVKFDPSPVRYSYLFSTNDWYAAVLDYEGKPFGATFTVANVSRNNAIVHGDDSLIYAGASSPVTQYLVVLGQNLEIADDEKVTRSNVSSIRKRGEILVEISSDWIQSKSMAKDLAVWMTKHWSDRVDELELEIFGNPLIELGDNVDIYYPYEDAIPASHKYFVVGANNSFDDGGISTTLTLRRNRPATDIS